MIKRIFLIIVTILVAINLLLSLASSFNQPQAQSRLQLYQSEIILEASAYEREDAPFKTPESLIGEDVYTTVQKQYEQALKETEKNLELLTEQKQGLATNLEQQEQITIGINKLEEFKNEIKLKIGLLKIKQGELEAGLSNWEKSLEIDNQSSIAKTAEVLRGLWQQPSSILPNAESIIKSNLDGWFRDVALQQLYQQENKEAALSILEQQQQEKALKAVIKLSLIGITPFLGIITGIIILIVLLIRWNSQGKEALLSPNSGYIWSVPWDGEIVWQVLIVGFFFISQFILPLVIGFAGVNPNDLSIPGRALYILVTYLMIAGSSLLVLYLSIRSFLPLPENWFSIKWRDNWIVWGLGGYFVAFPLVLLVSILNQQLWQGQGGSNPLILLVLESQNKLALLIFLATAAIAAPIFEEIIFRGFLLASLTRYFPAWGAIVVSSLIFSTAHLSLSEVLPLTMLGIILGFVYNRSQNLLSSILLHSLWNSGTLFSLFILSS